MKSEVNEPADDAELTRQVEMLMQGFAVDEMPGGRRTQPEPKRRTLDDMRRLSEHIKSVPIYQRK